MSLLSSGRAQESTVKVKLQKERRLVWVLVHMCIPGNGKAGELAREGAITSSSGSEPAARLFRRHMRGLVLKWTWSTFLKEWKESAGLREAKIVINSPPWTKAEWLLSRSQTKWALKCTSPSAGCSMIVVATNVSHKRQFFTI